MADIDLKAATPDTSLPSTGFLFGADSQSAASPSVYSTQTVATALLGSTALTGGTATTSTPILDMAQTWNAGAVTFTGWKLNVTDTASASGSLLMDLQVGGTSQFKVAKNGLITAGTGSAMPFGGDPTQSASWYVHTNSSFGYRANERLFTNAPIHFNGSVNSAGDLILSRRAAANLRLGAADAAAPVAQTLSVQSVVAGTTDTAGANLTITGSQGTGTGAGGSIIFQVAPAGSSGTAQNALATALTINSARQVSISGGSAAAPALTSLTDATTGIYFTSVGTHFASGGANIFGVRGEVRVASGIPFGFSSSDTVSSALDTILVRDAANTLAQRNGTNAQTKRLYGTYTDASNYRRLAMTMSTAGVAEIKPEGAGTGASGNVIHISGLPTSNPGPGILWNNAGTPAIGT